MVIFEEYMVTFLSVFRHKEKISTLIMRILFVFVFGLLSQFSWAQHEGKAIVDAISSSNGNAITKYIDQETEITVLDNEDSGEVGKSMVMKFFDTHKALGFQVKHEGTSKLGNVYRIGDLSTDKGSFRVTFFTKKTATGVKIVQFKIEQN